MVKQSACPQEADLIRLASGELPREAMETLAGHLETCVSCLAKVQSLAPANSVAKSLPLARKTSPALQDTGEVSGLIGKLKSLSPAPAVDILCSCAKCGKKLKVKSNLIGKKVKCPGCGQAVPVTAPAPGASLAEERTMAPSSPPGEQRTLPPETQAPLSKSMHSTPSDATAGLLRSARDDGDEAWDFLAPAQEPDEIGRLGTYRILKVLGRGGMGVVFRAEDPNLKRIVALKAMLPTLAASPSAKKRFLREAQTAASIKHDHIVTIHQVGEDRGAPFLAMEFLHGEPLDVRLKREGKLSIPEVLRIGRETAEGLAAAHDEGLIHRDIKPGNIWLEVAKRKTQGSQSVGLGRVKVLDFGLARSTDDTTGLTQSGAIIGTPAYMAPEQANGGAVDHRCDLFSLGCMLYAMTTGQLPFAGKDTMSILMAVAMSDPKPPRELNPNVPQELSDLVLRLLAKNAADRPADAHEVAAELQAMERIAAPQPANTAIMTSADRRLSNSGAMALQAPARIENQENRSPRSRRGIVIACGLACAALLAAGIVFFLPAGNGTIRVEINDPDIEVALTAKGIKIKGADKQGDIVVAPGEHSLKVTRGDLFFDTDKIVLKKGETVTVKVEWLEGRLAAVGPNGKVLGQQAAAPLPASGRNGLRFQNGGLVETAAVPLRPTNVGTIEAWLSVSDVVSLNFRNLVDTPNGNLAINGRKFTFSTVHGSAIAPDAPLNRIVHLAGVDDAKERRLYLDGKLVATLGRPSQVDKTMTDGPLKIGGNKCDITFYSVRVSKNVRYSADFTPVQRWQSDADTVALYQFDEGQGDVLTDSSGNGYHGKIIGAKWVKVDGTAPLPSLAPATHELDFQATTTVEVPSLKLTESGPITIEAALTRDPSSRPGAHFVGLPRGLRMRTRGTNHVGFLWGEFNNTKNDPMAIDGGGFPIPAKRIELALVYTGKEVLAFRDGKLLGRADSGAYDPRGDKGEFTIGGGLVGRLHGLRVSKLARYTADYTPATRLATDANTLALYQFDDGSGDIVKDSSGNGYHGKIVGANWVKANETPSTPKRSLAELLTSTDYEWSTPENLGPNVNSGGDDFKPTVSADGLCLIFASNRSGAGDLYECRRKSIDEPWGPATAIVSVNNSSAESSPGLSADGLTLLFASTSKRQGAQGDMDLYVSQRATRDLPWQVPVNLGPEINTSARDVSPCLGADGLTLYFVSSRESANNRGRVWVSHRKALDAAWQMPELLGPTINTNAPNNDLQLLPDDKSLLHTRGFSDSHKLYLATPAPVGGYTTWPIESPLEDGGFWLLADGQTLIFASRRAGGQGQYDLWQTRRIPKTKGIPAPPMNLALRFDGFQRVDIASLKLPTDSPYTMEGYFHPDEDKVGGVDNYAMGIPFQSHLSYTKNGDWRWAGAKGADAKAGIAGLSAKPRPHHIACVYDGKQRRVYVDGQQVGKSTSAPEVAANRTFVLGNSYFGTIGEVRVSKVARYQASFIPAKRFEPDADTLALYHCDQGQGDKLVDSSGNGHHGKIVGVKWVKGDNSPSAPSPYALQFPGIANYAEIPDLPLEIGKPVTVEYWALNEDKEFRIVLKNTVQIMRTDKAVHWFSVEGSAAFGVSVSTEMTPGKWSHIAAVDDGTKKALFVDGKPQATSPSKNKQPNLTGWPSFVGHYVGKEINARPSGATVKGVRVSRTARYTEAFTPPAVFAADADTVAVYRMDEGEGTKLTDSSGNGHHGKIVGAKWVKTDGTPIPSVRRDSELEFEAKTKIEIPSPQLPPSGPITIEAALTWSPSSGGDTHFVGLPKGLRIRTHSRNHATLHWGQSNHQAKTFINTGLLPNPEKRVELALVYTGKEFLGFRDGKLIGSADASDYDPKADHGLFTLGGGLVGRIHEVRVSTVARYAADYTPTPRFAPDKDTLALYHFDEGQGDVLTDSSGNGHHGKIVGAKWLKVDGTAPLNSAKDAERSFAVWLQEKMIPFSILEATKKTEINPGDNLPEGAFFIENLVHVKPQPIPHGELTSRLPQIAKLSKFNGGYLPRTDSDLWAEAFAAQPTITSVNAYVTDLTDKGMAHLARLPNLIYLNLHKSNQVTAVGLASLKGCKNLAILSLDSKAFADGKFGLMDVQKLQDALPNCRIGFESSTPIPGLKVVAIPAAPPTDAERRAFLEWFYQQQAMNRRIDIEQNGKTFWLKGKAPPGPFLIRLAQLGGGKQSLPDEFAARFAAFPEIQDLRLSIGSLEALTHLAPLNDLRRLTLDNVSIPAEGAKIVRGFTKLEHLRVPKPTDEWLKGLAGMPSLRSFYFYRQPISDSALATFKDFPNLAQVKINDCKLTEAGLLRLKEAKSLRLLTLQKVGIADAEAFKRLAVALPWCEIHHIVFNEPTVIYNKGKADGLMLEPEESPEDPMVHLDELTEKSFFALGGEFHKSGTDAFTKNWRNNFNMTGDPPIHALIIHPVPKREGHVAYDLGGRYATFQTTVRCRNGRVAPLYVEIFGDGRSLAKSENLAKSIDTGVELKVDVRGVKEMKIVIDAEEKTTFSHVLLLEPRLTPSATAPASVQSAPAKLGD